MRTLRDILEKIAERPKYFLGLWGLLIIVTLGAGGFLAYYHNHGAKPKESVNTTKQNTLNPKTTGTPPTPSKDSKPPGSPYQNSNVPSITAP